MQRAKLIHIPVNIISFDEATVEDREIPFDVANDSLSLKTFLEECEIVRGDVVHFEQYGNYRNDGRAIYDGAKLVDLDHDFIDYGTIPREFQVINEFPCDHFIDVNDHNTLVYFWPTPIDKNTIVDIIKSVRWKDATTATLTYIHPISREKYTIIVQFDISEDERISTKKRISLIREALNEGKYYASGIIDDGEPGAHKLYLGIYP